MRALWPFLFLTLIAAKGGKKKDEPAPPPPPPAAEPAPAPEAAPPAPEEPPAPKVIKNADFGATLTFADGTTKGGKVQGVERTLDFNGDEGWTTEEGKLKLTVEGGGTEKQVAWKDVKSIAIAPGKMPDEVDCTYSTDFNPWMYECVLRTNTVATLKDGTKGNITGRHRWRFTWDDGSTTEFTIFKHVVREQDDREIEFGQEVQENYALYTRLQDKIRSDLKGKFLKSVSVQ
ncbi:MAG: hypothetical protein ACOZNI_09010 [Myxococcota bacterium]